MTMIIQLLVASVAAGLTLAQEPPPPEYKQNLEALRAAADTIQTNLLSMEGNIPLLNDSRRHYAEIVHVIFYHAVQLTHPMSFHTIAPYYQNYDTNLNVSAPEAISDPEEVISEIRQLQNAAYDKSNKAIELIDSCILDSDVCNQIIDDTVKEKDDEYGVSATVLLAAGKAASVYNDLNKKFEEISNNFTAHHYVISSPEDLESIVYAVIHLLLALETVG